MIQGKSLRVNESHDGRICKMTAEDPDDEDLYMYNRGVKRMVREIFIFNYNNVFFY